MEKTIVDMDTESAMPGRFKCYACGHEHLLKKKRTDTFEVPEENVVYVFKRGSCCPKNRDKMMGMIREKDALVFYGQLHVVLDSYRQLQI